MKNPTLLVTGAVFLMITGTGGWADDGSPLVFVDAQGARYEILDQRKLWDGLKGVMVTIETENFKILMEMALDCPGEKFGQLAMAFDPPEDKSQIENIKHVQSLSDLIRYNRIGGVDMMPMVFNLENKSIVTIFDHHCAEG